MPCRNRHARERCRSSATSTSPIKQVSAYGALPAHSPTTFSRCWLTWKSLEDVEFATLAWLDWLDWFNNKRLLKMIGDRPLVDKEAEYYRKLEVSAIAA